MSQTFFDIILDMASDSSFHHNTSRFISVHSKMMMRNHETVLVTQVVIIHNPARGKRGATVAGGAAINWVIRSR